MFREMKMNTKSKYLYLSLVLVMSIYSPTHDNRTILPMISTSNLGAVQLRRVALDDRQAQHRRTCHIVFGAEYEDIERAVWVHQLLFKRNREGHVRASSSHLMINHSA
jgi:hypothetical protein